MSFGDTFWKVWEVRTSIKIQESIENFFNRPVTYDNTSEIYNALITTRSSWENKINQSRENTKREIRTLECELCNNRFNVFIKEGSLNKFSGIVYFEKSAFKIDAEIILNVTKQFQSDNSFTPLFYCSKKCALEDITIEIDNFG